MNEQKTFNHQSGRFVSCGDTELYLEELGPADAPTLLLLHGGMGSIEDFNPICPALADRFHLIGLDSRGHGRSRCGDRALSYAQLCSDLEKVVSSLALQAYGIIGFSDGGITACRFASTRPAGLHSLATIGSSWEMSEQDGAYGLYRNMTPQLWKRFFPASVKLQQALQPESDWTAFAAQVFSMWCDLSEQGHPGKLMKKIPFPFLAIRGEKDRLTSIESLVRLRQLTKKVHILNIPFADHVAFADEPAIVVSMIMTYLDTQNKR